MKIELNDYEINLIHGLLAEENWKTQKTKAKLLENLSSESIRYINEVEKLTLKFEEIDNLIWCGGLRWTKQNLYQYAEMK